MTATEATIHVGSFKTIYDLINNNKPVGVSVFSSFPEANPVFPCIIIHPVVVSVSKESFTIEARRLEVSCEIEFFALNTNASGKQKLDEMRDNVLSTILANDASLYGQGLLINPAKVWDDSNESSIEYKQQTLQTAAAILTLELK